MRDDRLRIAVEVVQVVVRAGSVPRGGAHGVREERLAREQRRRVGRVVERVAGLFRFRRASAHAAAPVIARLVHVLPMSDERECRECRVEV